jgi:hypothetical protein
VQDFGALHRRPWTAPRRMIAMTPTTLNGWTAATVAAPLHGRAPTTTTAPVVAAEMPEGRRHRGGGHQSHAWALDTAPHSGHSRSQAIA